MLHCTPIRAFYCYLSRVLYPYYRLEGRAVRQASATAKRGYRCVYVATIGLLFLFSYSNKEIIKISYIITILYICIKNNKNMTKVIHVQLMQGRRNYYFGSIPAIYSVLTAEDIGITQSSLERVGLSKGGVVLNKKAAIRAGELIRSKAKKRNG